ncbi:basic helix-loop-helix domain-containing protein USF3 [Ornithorhynchus anatinus]|uniref:Upstream transcription factor family member 3 n=1 Tax=Ornithorhynchus anatinus TaxID=9258 RepID=A0A6I8N301_ORNAN|nr:basic helix-loop-helix domain-containing protein USF3 [Ornithorhynchus anatinus]
MVPSETMPEMTENETPTKKQHRKKNRETHNAVERHRKKKINAGINRIGELIPCSPALKQSKNMILDQAFKYITELKRQNDQLLLNGGNNEQAEEIKKLRKQLDEIQRENGRYIELLKANDICLYDDPTVHWRGALRGPKVSVLIPGDPAPKNIIVCSHGGQPVPSGPTTPAQGITFGLGHGLQKQTANVVPVPRAGGPAAPGSGPREDKPRRRSPPPVPSAPAPSQEALRPPTSDGSRDTLPQSGRGAAPQSPRPPEGGISCGTARAPSPQEAASHSRAASGPDLAGSQPTRPLAPGPSPPADGGQKAGPAGGPGAAEGAAAGGAQATGPLAGSWPLPGTLSAAGLSTGDSKSPGSTQTTWSTLQLAGSTIQPLSQTTSGQTPTPLPSPAPAPLPFSTDKQPADPGAGSLTCPSLPVLSTQAVAPPPATAPPPPAAPPPAIAPPPAVAPTPHVTKLSAVAPTPAGILPLNPAMQVIQVAPPAGATMGAAPLNPNVIILQPPSAAPGAPGLRPDAPGQPLGQQIVIIQAAANQSPLPLVTAAPGTARVPGGGSGLVVGAGGTGQGLSGPQTFGGKHLVHILPRPASLSSTSLSVTVTSQPPPPPPPPPPPQTISLNGQLFALQPVTPSSGPAGQAAMQIIQPTTSEDPHTNVALNAFGALASLNQSISQMAGNSGGSAVPAPCAPPPSSAPASRPPEKASGLSLATPGRALPGSKTKRTSKRLGPRRQGAGKVVGSGGSARGGEGKPELANPDGPPALSPCHGRQDSGPGVLPGTSGSIPDCASLEGLRSEPAAPSSSPQPGTTPSQSTRDPGPSPPDPKAPVSLPPPRDSQAGAPAEAGTSQSSPCCVSGVSATPPPADPPGSGPAAPGAVMSSPPGAEHTHEASAVAAESCTIRTDVTATVPVPAPESVAGFPGLPSDLPGGTGQQMPSQLDPSPASLENSTPAEPCAGPAPSDLRVAGGGDSPSGPGVLGGALPAGRQEDSSLAAGPGGSRGFSVASMLPDPARGVSGSSSTASGEGCLFREPTDIVALAARAIFDPENPNQGRTGVRTDGRDGAPRPPAGATPFGAPAPKGSGSAPADCGSRDHQAGVGRPCETLSCLEAVGPPGASLQAPASQAPSLVRLSVSSLVHPRSGSGGHPPTSGTGPAQSSEQEAIPGPASLPPPAGPYTRPPPGPPLLASYSQEQLAVLPAAHSQDAPRKPGPENRKDATPKRAGRDDACLPTAKRQKSGLPTPLRPEGVPLAGRTLDSLSDQAPAAVGGVAPTPGPPSGLSRPDGLSRLFLSSAGFGPTAGRPADGPCCPQPLGLEQLPSQAPAQHLQPPTQHLPAQGGAQLHGTHLYLKQQQQVQQQGQQQQVQQVQQQQVQQQQQQQPPPPPQQAAQGGQLRERHHLYQLQHHHGPLGEGSLHGPPHGTHQQRVLQPEVQMQKKRNLVPVPPAPQLSLQAKLRGNDQSRAKVGQPHPHHHQQMPPTQPQHFAGSQSEKSCDNHHGHPPGHLNPDVLHPPQEAGARPSGTVGPSEHGPGPGQMQRLLTVRGLDQQPPPPLPQMVPQPPVAARPSELSCGPHRQERHRVSSYSAEALIGKPASTSESRLGLPVQGARGPEQLDVRGYLGVPRNKGPGLANMQTRGEQTPAAADLRQAFKPSGSAGPQPPGSFEAQPPRNGDVGHPAPALRAPPAQAFRVGQGSGPPADRQKRVAYPAVQGGPTGATALPREGGNPCHQSFMQSLLASHLGEPALGHPRPLAEHSRSAQCGPLPALEYACPPVHDSVRLRRDGDGQGRESCDLALGALTSRSSGALSLPFSSPPSSSGDVQGRNPSPGLVAQKIQPGRMSDGHGGKSHVTPVVSSSMHGGARPGPPHPPGPRGGADPGPPIRPPNTSIPQRSRHPLQDGAAAKLRPPERSRPGPHRHGNVFDPTLPALPHLPLPGGAGGGTTGGSMILGRQQPGAEKRGGIVRFVPESPQGPSDPGAAPDQHTLSQNFSFPFLPEGGMNAPLNANASFMPPVTQAGPARAPTLLPVDSQNALPSFYPPYSPAHPPLPNDLSIPYFSNQMFSNPGPEKADAGGLNNRFGSILSPPRPVGFAQPSFPLLPDMAPVHVANPAHLPNFNMTSLFPEIASALPDGSAGSPLLSVANPAASDSAKQPSNRPAHNISHILGHDCSSAV